MQLYLFPKIKSIQFLPKLNEIIAFSFPSSSLTVKMAFKRNVKKNKEFKNQMVIVKMI